jgi:hypothetical protein
MRRTFSHRMKLKILKCRIAIIVPKKTAWYLHMYVQAASGICTHVISIHGLFSQMRKIRTQFGLTILSNLIVNIPPV